MVRSAPPPTPPAPPTPAPIFFEYSISTLTVFPMSLLRRNSLASAPYGSPGRSREAARGVRMDESVMRRSTPLPFSATTRQSPETTSTTVPWNVFWFCTLDGLATRSWNCPLRAVRAARSVSRSLNAPEPIMFSDHSAPLAKPAPSSASARSAFWSLQSPLPLPATGHLTCAMSAPCWLIPSSTRATSRLRHIVSHMYLASRANGSAVAASPSAPGAAFFIDGHWMPVTSTTCDLRDGKSVTRTIDPEITPSTTALTSPPLPTFLIRAAASSSPASRMLAAMTLGSTLCTPRPFFLAASCACSICS